MLNYLQNCQKSTPIGRLSDIINHNNQAITDEFNWIFDSSSNRLTKSVYVPTGSVKAHFGEFVNLSCEYLTIKNPESLKPVISGTVKDIISDNIDSHNVLSGRFSSAEREQAYKGSDYLHDAYGIAYTQFESVGQKLEEILSSESDTASEISRVERKTDIEKETRELQVSNLQNRAAGLEQTTSNLNDDVNNLKEQLTDANLIIDNLKLQIEQLTNELTNLKSLVGTANNNLEQING